MSPVFCLRKNLRKTWSTTGGLGFNPKIGNPFEAAKVKQSLDFELCDTPNKARGGGVSVRNQA